MRHHTSLAFLSAFLGAASLATAQGPAPSIAPVVSAAAETAPKQAGLFNTAVVPATPEEDTDRSDFWKLFGVLLSPDMVTGGPGGKIKLVSNLNARLNVSSTFTDPKLRSKVLEAFDAKQQREALGKLDLLDDALYELRLKAYGDSPTAIRQATLLLSSVVNRRMEKYAQDWTTRRNALLDWLLANDPAYKVLVDRRNTLSADAGASDAVKAAAAREVQEYVRERQEVMPELLGRGLTKQLVRLQRAYQNRLQVHGTVRYRSVDALVGQNELGFGGTAQWGFPSLPGWDPAAADTAQKLDQWLEGNADRLDNPHLFSIEVAWREKRAATVAGRPELDEVASKQFRISGTWQTKVFPSVITVKSTPVGADQSLTFSYVHPRSGSGRDRFIVTESLVFHLTDAIALPLSVTYANRSEFVDAREVRGNLGVSFSIQKD